MNLSMFQRVIDRHRYMQEFAPYREFLQHVRDRADVWRVAQVDFARWWERRYRAALDIETISDGRLRVSSALRGASVELEDTTLHPLPAELRSGTTWLTPRVAVPAERLEIARAMVRHLGCGHVDVQTGEDPLLARFDEQLSQYLNDGLRAARAYPVALVEALREVLVHAHRRAGVPFVRLWTLPLDPTGRPYRAAFSPRFDVDKAMVNVPMISQLHAEYDMHGTFYIRPMGVFYGRPEIQKWSQGVIADELALHGEFVTTGEQRFGDEWKAAVGEKALLEEMLGREVLGLCTHGGELRTNQTPNTPSATDRAGFLYETTFYERPYYLPMYLPCPEGVRPTQTILRHQDDVTLPLTREFGPAMVSTFSRQLDEARAMGGVFVPTMHPLYFDLRHYLSQGTSWYRLARFAPVFAMRAARMKRGQLWANQSALYGE